LDEHVTAGRPGRLRPGERARRGVGVDLARAARGWSRWSLRPGRTWDALRTL
jgi:hypothetical protein